MRKINTKFVDALFPAAPLLRHLAAQVGGSEIAKGIGRALTIDELQDQTRRKEFEMAMARDEARVAQELAIAERILVAEEVEIEEFYDTSANGSLGIKAEGQTITAGASGGGKRVVKRVYKFRGFRDVVEEDAPPTDEAAS